MHEGSNIYDEAFNHDDKINLMYSSKKSSDTVNSKRLRYLQWKKIHTGKYDNMNNVYLLWYFFVSMIVNLSCSAVKPNHYDKISLECNENMSCIDFFQCSKQLLKKGEYRYRFSDSIASRQLLLCTGQLASEGNKEAHKYLIEYFNVKKAFHVNHQDRYQQNPAIFASSLNSPEVVAFSKLRGTEAFELALAYIERCVCRPFIKNSDETYPSEETYTIIDYIIDPMIKTIDGKNRLYLYFNLKPELISTPIKGVSGKIEHEYKYNALKKAYNEGKIILKKYGE